jgi:hypothetical protein
MTLLQSIDTLIENITVTDRQEENIKNSLSNIEGHLKAKDNGLHVDETFTNGSWERDTVIRPLNDIDLFAVLCREKWQDEYGNLPSPQSVLTKIKNYLNDVSDYKDKVSQDRPCVTIKLSDKNFDVLPSFMQLGGGYVIPNNDLSGWTFSYPEQLTKDLNDTHKLRSYKLKPVIKVIKHWNREFNGKLIPSYHIEEAAINIFKVNSIANYEVAIRLWFENAEYNLHSYKFKSNDQYTTAINRINKVKNKLIDAKKLYDEGKGNEATQIWKDIFGKEFPSVEAEEAKNFAKSLMEGVLKVSSAGTLSQAKGMSIGASKGFFGDVPNT